jgi:16S rRNA (adenine1518-N6/adenine1519-N6)-dimethyltransferase
MTLAQIRQTLSEHGLQLTRSLGQNFLHDINQLHRIVAAAEIKPEDAILEIGPGLGALTQLLTACAGQLWAIEKDARLVKWLREHFAESTSLSLLQADALRYLEDKSKDWSDWKVVSNLPYSVASPILVELAQLPLPPKRLVVTVQWEVAQRLQARPGTKAYGILTLLVQARYQPTGVFKIPPQCFFPPPNVDSACISLQRRDPALLDQTRLPLFSRVVKLSFSQRRKMMVKLLRTAWPEDRLRAGFKQAGIDWQARAETVSLAQYISLTQFLGMPDEWFDVVDDQDQVVGQHPRSEVHRLGLKHRSVHILINNRDGKIFLQQRSQNKDRCPGLWDSSASGHLDAGEAYETAAVRELQEELGWRPERPLEPLFKIDACPETDQEFTWVYRCQSEGPFQLNPDEIQGGGWYSPAELDDWVSRQPEAFADSFRHIWLRLQQHG